VDTARFRTGCGGRAGAEHRVVGPEQTQVPIAKQQSPDEPGRTPFGVLGQALLDLRYDRGVDNADLHAFHQRAPARCV
jgi:hypothetical protein